MSLPTSADDPFGRSTSGQTSFTLTTNEIIKESFDILEIAVEGEDLSEEMQVRGKSKLNLMLKTWQSQGLHLSSYSFGFLFLVKEQREYILEQSNCTEQYFQRTLTADAVATDTVLNVDNTDNLLVDDFIGVMDDDFNLMWSKVDSIDTGLLTVTIEDPLPRDASEPNEIFNYTEVIRPIARLLDIQRRENFLNDNPIVLESRNDYFFNPSKIQFTGVPSEAYYSRSIPQGKLFLWPIPENSAVIIPFNYERLIENMVNADDCIDLDQSYLEAVTYSLAARLGASYGVGESRLRNVQIMADSFLDRALSYDQELPDIKISLNREVR